ncbi:MAG: helix-turn-helix transcriptional regulator [Nitriliruptoraceae bacterium]
MNDAVPAKIAGNVRRLRRARGWSVAELSRRSGRSARTLVKLEAGNNPTISTLVSVADALGVPFAHLMFTGVGAASCAVDVVRGDESRAPQIGAILVSSLARAPVADDLEIQHMRLGPGVEHLVDVGAAEHRLVRIFVVDGTLEFGPHGCEVHVRAGDFASVAIDQGRCVYRTSEGARILLISCAVGAEWTLDEASAP